MSDHCVVASIDAHTAEPGDVLVCEASVLAHARPEVLVLIAPEDVDVIRVIAGAYLCTLERRSREVSQGRVEYVLTCSHDVAPGLAITVHLKAPTGGEIRGMVLGTRANR